MKKKMLKRNFFSLSKYAYEIDGDKAEKQILQKTTPNFFKMVNKIEKESKNQPQNNI